MAVSTVNGAAAAGSSGSASGASSAAEQTDRFMKLLVAQMRNQDPLNPMDNAQMTSQIAQINTVAGLEKLNGTVQGLVGSLAAMQLQAAAQLPGRGVLVPGSGLTLADGQAAVGGVELATGADRVEVQVVAADGSVVRTLSLGALPAGVRNFSWDGRNDAGAAVATGDYRLRVAASAQGQPVDATALTRAQVRSVLPGSDGVQLDLGDRGLQAMSDVRAFL